MMSVVHEMLFQVENSRQRGHEALGVDPVFQRAREDLLCLKSRISIVPCQGNFPLLSLLLSLPWTAHHFPGNSMASLPPHLRAKSRGPVLCLMRQEHCTGSQGAWCSTSALSQLSCAISLESLTLSGPPQLSPFLLELL